jgi:hypothetical protein
MKEKMLACGNSNEVSLFIRPSERPWKDMMLFDIVSRVVTLRDDGVIPAMVFVV